MSYDFFRRLHPKLPEEVVRQLYDAQILGKPVVAPLIWGEGRAGLDTPARSVKAAPSADPSFFVREIFVYPNPARNGENPRFRASVGLADEVSVSIYDAAGEAVHQADFGAPRILGTENGSQYVYEYAWDVSRMASGVYVAVVRAQKSGHPRLEKTLNLAIVK